MTCNASIAYLNKSSKLVLNDFALANVEALASGESSNEFTEKTGCVAVQEKVSCKGKDGNTHSYAEKK